MTVTAPLRLTPSSAPPGVVSGPGAFRHDIEGLRAVAVLLVVGFHAGIPGVGGGYAGVDVFFVLSGYLITGLLVREMEERGRLDLVRFYARRARRLLPGAALMMAVTALAVLWLLPPLEQLSVSKATGAASVYASNVWFMWRLGDYVVTGTEANPLLHTWSLAVEEQFYVVWPVAVWLMFRTRSRARLAWCMALASLASLAFCVWLTDLRQPWAFYASPARAWEFGIGGLAALLPAWWLADRRRLRGALAWLGMAAIAFAAATFSEDTRFPGAIAAIPVLGTAAVLVAGAGAPGAVQKVLHTPVLQHIGRLSYSWYLWHWPALVLAAVLVPELGVPGRVLVSLWALAVAALAYTWVEHPIRSHRGLMARPRATLAVTAGLACVSLALTIGWTHRAEQRSLSPRFRDYTNAAWEDWWYDCMVSVTKEWLPPCVAGDAGSATTVVLFGDSHASQWQPAMERIAELRGWRLVTLVKPICPAADVKVMLVRWRRPYRECMRWRRRALEHIRELRPAAVVMASTQSYVLGPARSGVSISEWKDGTRRTAAMLDSLGIRTVLLHDTPAPERNVPLCLSRVAYSGPSRGESCDMWREAAMDPGVRLAERDALRGLRHATAIDPAAWFCTGPVCESVREGKVVYRDASHIAPSYARHLAPALMPRLDAVMRADAAGAAALD